MPKKPGDANGAWNRCTAEYTFENGLKRCGRRTKQNNVLCPYHTEEKQELVEFSQPGKRATRSTATDRDPYGNKCCCRCGVWKPVSEFSVRAAAPDRLNYSCKVCCRLAGRACIYNITVEHLLSIYEHQERKCAICSTALDIEQVGNNVCVDHDHSCCPETGAGKTCGKCVRGLLCRSCNFFIGIARDDSNILLQAVEYLARDLSVIHNLVQQ